MRSEVHGVDVDVRADRVSGLDDRCQIRRRAEQVRRAGQRDPLGVLIDQFDHIAGRQLPRLRIEGRQDVFGACIIGCPSPWSDVGVVVEPSADNAITRSQRRADRPRDREGQRRHVRTKADPVRVCSEELPDGGTRAVHQSLAFLGRRKGPAVGCGVAARHPLAHCRDRRVDHLRTGWPVEPRPLRSDSREPVTQRRHRPKGVFGDTPCGPVTLDWPRWAANTRMRMWGQARLARLASRFAVRPMGTMLRWSRSPTSIPLAKATL